MAIITFNQYRVDTVEKACERVLSQFKNSTKGILQFINALVEQTQSLNDAELSVFLGRSLDGAVGVQLDIIGRIVGIERPLLEGDEILYFQFDSLDSPAQWWDSLAGWFVENAPTTGTVASPDSLYRRFIAGKIFKNQCTGGTIPEIIVFNKIVFNVDSSVVPVMGETMAIDIKVPSTINPQFIPLFTASTSNSNVENEYFLPIPAGVRVNSVILV